ncbi:hypothetical protein D7294_13515 [Streptomyces hoynatensis]|uniref:Uncharacterized protein n=1 Tax=Streptomyces hoynatensis TaxID=1141874 RepID=A0A3A9Z1U3_9ACTN|nr:hypothetical protein D7294_13515 [Streptomyces hoynatensis]
MRGRGVRGREAGARARLGPRRRPPPPGPAVARELDGAGGSRSAPPDRLGAPLASRAAMRRGRGTHSPV